MDFGWPLRPGRYRQRLLSRLAAGLNTALRRERKDFEAFRFLRELRTVLFGSPYAPPRRA